MFFRGLQYATNRSITGFNFILSSSSPNRRECVVNFETLFLYASKKYRSLDVIFFLIGLSSSAGYIAQTVVSIGPIDRIYFPQKLVVLVDEICSS